MESILSATGAAGRVFGRSLVVVEEGAKATMIDRYRLARPPGARCSASSVVELYVGQGAELEHVSVIDWGAGVRHHALLRARVDRDARARSVVVTLGGDVVRVEPTMVCAGPGSDARALGLYFAGGEQHFEHRVVARHEAPQAYSNLLYKGAIQDHAHTVFFGNLVVPPGAPGTDAYQTNRNLVLNEGARADTIPFLEIETAEVKCSHAGAVGRVDDEHLFYLRSRGVPEAERQAADRDGLPPGGPGAGEPGGAAGRARDRRPGEAGLSRRGRHRARGPRRTASRASWRSTTRRSAWSTSTARSSRVHDVCTHALESLSGGWVEGDRIECPRHGAAFSLRSGEALTPPAIRPLPTFAVEVRDGRVLVDPTPSRAHPLIR